MQQDPSDYNQLCAMYNQATERITHLEKQLSIQAQKADHIANVAAANAETLASVQQSLQLEKIVNSLCSVNSEHMSLSTVYHHLPNLHQSPVIKRIYHRQFSYIVSRIVIRSLII